MGERSAGGWLFGPVPDLMLGCGGLYALVFAALTFAGPELRAALPVHWMPLVLLAVGTPHYGATLLRVYERREDRRAYAIFSVGATLVIAAWFAVAVRSVAAGSLLFTIYMLWSPWHYSAQNYGVAMMLLRRRGVEIPADAKRALHASFGLSFLLTVLATQSALSTEALAPVEAEGTAVQLLRLGLPFEAVNAALLVTAALYVGGLGFVALRLRGRASAADLVPLGGVVGMQSLWFVAPLLLRRFGLLGGVDSVSAQYGYYAFLWVAVGHSVQYLWVTAYFARRSGRAGALAPWYTRALLAGAAIWAVPALLVSPPLGGALPYDGGLALLVASAVNLHHFVLDGAIWKLRDGRIARILIRREEVAPASAAPARSGLRPAPALWGLAAVGLAVVLAGHVEHGRARAAMARGDLATLEQALGRLTWIGRESDALRAHAAAARTARGELEAALHHAERAVALRRSADALGALAGVFEAAGRPERAEPLYREALAASPGDAAIRDRLARLLAHTAAGRPERAAEAVTLAEAALREGVRDALPHLETLALAYAAAGRPAEADRVLAEMRRVAGAGPEAARLAEASRRVARLAAARGR